jgi:Lon protease-like protein
MDVVRADIEAFRTNSSNTPLLLEEKDNWAIAGVASLREKHVGRVLHGGRLVATYTMTEMGELAYDADVVYTTVTEIQDDYGYLDVAVLEHLKEATRTELDCQVCYALFLDPLTTSCGHTFCRNCLRRALDHSICCPICRRDLNVAPTVTEAQYPSNKRLSLILSGLCPEALAARAEALLQEDAHQNAELDTPLFICTMSFPSMPTFLHIFEPRYKLMIRRAIESGDRRFGMLLHNPQQSPQGELGAVPFYQYGTLLHIVNLQLLPDGRSLIETVGVSRFRVVKHGILDAYQVGQVERIDDISLSEEEALEASETANAPPQHPQSVDAHLGSLPHHQPSQSQAEHVRRAQESLNGIDTMSTKALMDECLSFVFKMSGQSAPWMHSRVIQSYGECPVDPALFPWWFASILPIAESEKYKLLGTTSVRQRLKICLGWVIRIEAQRW